MRISDWSSDVCSSDLAARLAGSGPVVLVVDDGWSAARFWPARQTAADNLLAQAEREDRPVVVLTTAPSEQDAPPQASGLLSATEARSLLQGLKPKPWPADRRDRKSTRLDSSH